MVSANGWYYVTVKESAAQTPSEPTVEPEPPTEPEQERDVYFSDVNAEFWAYDAIQSLAKKGIILGYPNDELRPNETTRREHMIVMLARLGLITGQKEVAAFTDVPEGYVYYDEIRWAQEAGIIDGSQGKFHPKNELTRGQAAKIIALLFGFEQGNTTPFDDVSEDEWYAPYVSALAAKGIVLGDGGNFKPNASITRAQFAAMLYRTLGVVGE